MSDPTEHPDIILTPELARSALDALESVVRQMELRQADGTPLEESLLGVAHVTQLRDVVEEVRQRGDALSEYTALLYVASLLAFRLSIAVAVVSVDPEDIGRTQPGIREVSFEQLREMWSDPTI